MAIRCRYNSTTDWVREVEVLVSPYAKRVLVTSSILPRLEPVERSSIPWLAVVAVLVSTSIAVGLVVARSVRARRTKGLSLSAPRPAIAKVSRASFKG